MASPALPPLLLLILQAPLLGQAAVGVGLVVSEAPRPGPWPAASRWHPLQVSTGAEPTHLQRKYTPFGEEGSEDRT